MCIMRVTKKNRPRAGRISRQGFLTSCKRNGMQNQTIPIREIIFYERAVCHGKGKRKAPPLIFRDRALSHGTCTTNLCNNLAPRRRVKCANVGNRHESVRKPLSYNHRQVIKSEERRCDALG